MSIFHLSHNLIQDYARYVQSFLNISDDRVRQFVEQELVQAERLWPPPLLQVNSNFEFAETIADLCRQDVLHPLCTKIFYDDERGQSRRLYHHQREAIERGLKRHPFVVTSGTGSGKTFTYLIPIFDAILRHPSDTHSVRAILVYPMNALVNSQEKALHSLAESFKRREGRDLPVRFAKYTGQENEAEKQALQQAPPHILLTNYMMLELMLVRPRERIFVDRATSALEFLVFDELHTYRGRQGADAALLIRRLRERCGNPHLMLIGTSATMVAGRGLEGPARRQAVSEFASKLFGLPVLPENIIEEKLRRITTITPTSAELRRALDEPLPDTLDALLQHPLTAWVEENFGVEQEPNGNLRRRLPTSLEDGAAWLAQETGAAEAKCKERLRELFLCGAQIKLPDGNPLLGFKLHHFVAQGRTVYTTLENPATREFSLGGEYYARGQTERLFYPLVFCRVCGQDYYAVRQDPLTGRLVPWEWEESDADSDERINGYVLVHPDGADWDVGHLPAEWQDRNGRIKRTYRPHVPIPLWVQPDGAFSEEEIEGARKVWFQPAPFMLCLNCGEFYRRDRNDFRKLARLSSEGRSTTTTVLTTSALVHAPAGGIPDEARKVMSFTDNRQDASLQAGHFNDFVQVSLLRAAIYAALEQHHSLRYDTIAGAVFQTIGLELRDYARNALLDPTSPSAQDVRETLRDWLEYRIYEDLRRGWRVVQPNLEQCGLLRIEYQGLDALCANESKWQSIAPFKSLSPERRREIITAFLDHLRRKLAIKIQCLEDAYQQQLVKRVQQNLNETLAFEPGERLRTAERFLLPDSDNQNIQGLSLSASSLIGRYLCRTLNLTGEQYATVLPQLVELLCAQGLLWRDTERGTDFVQLDAHVMMWCRGDGMPPPPDPIYSRRAASQVYQEVQRRANAYFSEFYQKTARALKGVEGREHTAQVRYDEREEREKRFAQGELDALFCSPTMELGIDIRDLQMVHMRNVPPTPANYAQRSGRAGRGSEPALVMTYCSARSGHDQYFFRRRNEMVAGAVRTPRLDLGNQDLIRAHVHAIWLANVGLRIDNSIADLVDRQQNGYPLIESVRGQIELSEQRRRECQEQARRILQTCDPDLFVGGWYSEEWLAETLQRAPAAFDRAFDRWRELYRAAEQQWNQANEILRYPPRDKDLRRAAERQRAEAERQKNLLCNLETTREETDFYPYRYLASEGFLPGYNFPRLPIRAFVPRGDGEFITRPRFLALTEFGPQNIIYHEGNKYQANALIAPPGGLEQHRQRAKLCGICGYFLENTGADLCEHCHSRLDASNSHLVPLLAMSNVRTIRRERITCDEEERRRWGYEVTTHFSFAPEAGGQARLVEAEVLDASETPLLRLVYAPTATLYRINHGWRNRREKGFAINLRNGEWLNHPEADEDETVLSSNANVQREVVRLYVRDTQNLLLVYFHSPELRSDDNLLATLQFALQRGMELTFQIEESELAVERIGSGEQRALLFWEAAEGGVGVLGRLVSERDLLSQIARAALERCHFDPDTLEDRHAECARACYDCLMSYSNQRDHPRLNRHLAKNVLAALTQCSTRARAAGRSYDDQYHWLRALTDTRSELERKFLDHLYTTKRRLPDEAQKQLSDYYAQPDFFYEPNVCVFCDGAVHDEPGRRAEDEGVRRELKNKGYRVVVIRYDADLEEQISNYSDIFGI
jgi:superfamily II DNA/RNA helicase